MFQHRIFFNVMHIFWHDCFGGVMFHTGVMEPQRLGGFLGEKCCGHFSITNHQYPKKTTSVDSVGLMAWLCGSTFFFLISGAALHKSEMVQIYAYDFVEKGDFMLLTLFWKYNPLDKHFKHGFRIFRPIFNNLLYTMDGYG